MTSSVSTYVYTILSCIAIIGALLLFWYYQVSKRKNAPIQLRADSILKRLH